MPARDEDPKEIAKQLYVVLKTVMALFENGQIVRNKEHDADFEWLQKQAELPGVRLRTELSLLVLPKQNFRAW
jgi:hypothetical protein